MKFWKIFPWVGISFVVVLCGIFYIVDSIPSSEPKQDISIPSSRDSAGFSAIK